MVRSLRTDAVIGFGTLRRLFAAVVLVFAFLTPGWVLAQTPVPVFFALLQPGQEVPPTDSNAFGNAFMTFDTSNAMLCYSISYADAGAPDLSSGETVAHFHGPALPGATAGVLFDISPAPSPVGSPKTGCVGPLTGAQLSDLIDGLWYINIHSSDFPAGEIRGQVIIQRVL